jgi:hypothetical protein
VTGVQTCALPIFEDALAKIQARAEKIHAQGDINPGQPHVSQFTR